MEIRPSTIDTEGHAVAVEYEHTGAVYTQRAAICTLKESVELLAIESQVTTCEACLARLGED